MTARHLPPGRAGPRPDDPTSGRNDDPRRRARPQGRSASTPQGARVLLGLSDGELRDELAVRLERDGHVVATAADGVELLERLADRVLEEPDRPWPDIVVADADLPGRAGIDLLADLRAVGWPTPFVLTARPGDPALVDAESRYDGLAIFEEPFEVPDILTAVAVLLHGVGVALWYPEAAHQSRAFAASAWVERSGSSS